VGECGINGISDPGLPFLGTRLDGDTLAGLIVHEWAEPAGGAERVVEEMLAALPDAELQVLWNDAPGRFPTAKETWLARTPLRRHKALALPLMIPTWRTVRARSTPDWILTSSHLFAHHVAPRDLRPLPPKYSYVHTPARYIWEPQLDERGRSPMVRLASAALKGVDRKRAAESRVIAANSEFTRARIQRVWERDAIVIYPPVDVDRIASTPDWRIHLDSSELAQMDRLPGEFLLGASRFVPYKRLDQVIAAGEASGLPVVLAGSGPARAALLEQASQARVPVHIVDRPSNAMLYSLYQAALALVFPAIEDFGIVPVEAIAAGTPVIARSVGGAAESIQLLNGGALVSGFSPVDWRAAIEKAALVDARAAQKATGMFSAARFRTEIAALVGTVGVPGTRP